MGVSDQTVEAFLASLSAATPTPGGGSVSALAGALSVALSRMVGGLALGKAGYEGAQAELRDLEARARILQRRLLNLADEDAAAYDGVLRAMRLPKSNDSERATRISAVQAAYRRAAEVPLETVERCVEALELARQAAEWGNRGASTDCGVAALLAEAAARGAGLNVRVNLSSIRDDSFRGDAEAKLAELMQRADRLSRETMAIVDSRL
jgi:formiminotetrahydrofolate cyclodeaminase